MSEIREIPDFLRPENRIEDPVGDKMLELIDEYNSKIGGMLITEPSSYTDEEWIEMLQECIEKNITIWELWGEEYDPEADY